MIIDTIVGLKNGDVETSRGMAIAANFKVLNDNVQAEINAAKMAIKAKEVGYDFGRVVGMGQKVIGNSSEQIS
jgi:hypothetical protein